jgi:hypothetical protein
LTGKIPKTRCWRKRPALILLGKMVGPSGIEPLTSWRPVTAVVPSIGYPSFFAQVRETNLALPPEKRIHVWLGEPVIDWDKLKSQAPAAAAVPVPVMKAMGADFYMRCTNPPADRGAQVVSVCAAYVAGIADDLKDAGKVCLAPGVTPARLLPFALNWIRLHMQNGSFPAVVQIRTGLVTTFPCGRITRTVQKQQMSLGDAVSLGKQWWAEYAGLNLPPTHVLIVVAAFAVVATGSEMLLPIVYKAAVLKVNAPTIEEQTGFLFQAFNEEIVFRALMIGFFIQYVRSALMISLGLAFIFAAAHFLLYRFGTLHMALSMASLATLYFAGVAWNNLFLSFRHIGFSWALHARWNVVWLPAAFYDASTNGRLYEPQVFDRVLGSPAIVAMACATAVLSFVFLARRPPTSAAIPSEE